MKKVSALVGFLLTLLSALPAWAVQGHGAAEGPVVHMMAHLLLGISLLLFLYVLHTRPPDPGLTWRSLKLALLFFLLWDLDHLFVHWVAGQMHADIRDSGSRLVADYFSGPRTLLSIFYYLARFDHLLCVPALWFFTSALRGYTKEIERRSPLKKGQAV